jgi:hypothetical protein
MPQGNAELEIIGIKVHTQYNPNFVKNLQIHTLWQPKKKTI